MTDKYGLGMGVVTKRELIRHNPGIVSSMLKAYVEGIKKEYVDVIPKAPYPAVDPIMAKLKIGIDLQD